MVKMKKVHDGVSDHLKTMANRSKSMQSFFNRVTFKQYQNAQRRRWMTGGDSEGDKWKPLTNAYRTAKRKRFADYPGGGKKLMIATGALFEASVDKAYKFASNTRLVVSVNPGMSNPETGEKVKKYAEHANKARPFMKFGKETIHDMKEAIRNYIKSGGMIF